MPFRAVGHVSSTHLQHLSLTGAPAGMTTSICVCCQMCCARKRWGRACKSRPAMQWQRWFFLVSMERWWGGSFSLHLWSISVSASWMSQMTCCISATLEGFNFFASCKMHPISACQKIPAARATCHKSPEMTLEVCFDLSVIWSACPQYIWKVCWVTMHWPAVSRRGSFWDVNSQLACPTGRRRSPHHDAPPEHMLRWNSPKSHGAVYTYTHRMVLFTHIADQISLDQNKGMFGNTWTVG